MLAITPKRQSAKLNQVAATLLTMIVSIENIGAASNQRDLKMRIEIALSLLVCCLAGCQTLGPNAATGGAFGGLAGGLAGAAIGSTEGKSPEGALIGAVTGAAVGSIAGDAVDRDVQQQQFQHQQFRNQKIANAITTDQIVRMTQSGLGPDVIGRQIATQGVAHRPTIDELIFLKQNQVDDRVIHTLQNAPVAGQDVGAVRTVPIPVVEPAPILVEPVPHFRPRRFWAPPRCVRRSEPGVELFFGF